MTYLGANRIEMFSLLDPFWQIPIYPTHYHQHFSVDFLYFCKVPANRFVMINPIAQFAECV